MLKAVLFDMDGVLIDSEWVYFEIQTKIAKELNLPLKLDFKENYCGTPSIVFWKDFTTEFNVNVAPETLCAREVELLFDYCENGELIPIESAIWLLKHFVSKGIPCAIATSNKEKFANAVVTRLGLKEEISFISNADVVKNAKPAPDVFLLAAQALNVNAWECLVIEDSANGITAAKAAGMAAIGFVSPNSGNQDFSSADYITNDLQSLTHEFCEALVDKVRSNT